MDMEHLQHDEHFALIVDQQQVPVQAEQQSIIPRPYPQVIKYMGSKAAILPFVAKGLSKVFTPDRPIVDLFSGACAISAGFGHRARIISNDIQEYSATIASAYLHPVDRIDQCDIVSTARQLVQEKQLHLPDGLTYPSDCSLSEFNVIEERNRALINMEFDFPYHLFTRAYSGTWWSAEQCLWIDSIRQALDQLRDRGDLSESDFKVGLTCLMHAMAYTSQGTGHYAQYRDAKNVSSMKDIQKYRRLTVSEYFTRKLISLTQWNRENAVELGHETYSLDYKQCLECIPSSIVYADPPYAFVHYSRFYHAIETIVRYDYPELQFKAGEMVKGRYRVDRHQSPFCISTKVRSAFVDLFHGVKQSKSDLVLSYSNTGMIDIQQLIALAQEEFGGSYTIWVEGIDHDHMTMGRREDRDRQVEESIVVAKRR